MTWFSRTNNEEHDIHEMLYMKAGEMTQQLALAVQGAGLTTGV